MRKIFWAFFVFFISVTLVYSQNSNDENAGQDNEIKQQKQIKNVFAINVGYLITALKSGDGF